MEENNFLTDADLMATVADINNLNKKINSIPAGPAGPAGLAGDTIQNYGDSLIRNGALELGNLQGWTGATLGDSANGLYGSIKTTSLVKSTYGFIPQYDCLYSVEFYVKNEGTVTAGGGIIMDEYKADQSYTDVSLRIYSAGVTTWVASNSTTFVKKKYFFGGLGTLTFNIKEGTTKLVPIVFKNEGTSISVNGLIIKQVSLGEPVPYTLPYLPTGQMVYDPSNYRIGIYNGSAVKWQVVSAY